MKLMIWVCVLMRWMCCDHDLRAVKVREHDMMMRLLALNSKRIQISDWAHTRVDQRMRGRESATRAVKESSPLFIFFFLFPADFAADFAAKLPADFSSFFHASWNLHKRENKLP